MSRPADSPVRRPRESGRRAPGGAVLIVGALAAIGGFFLHPLVGIGLLVILLSFVHRALRIPLLVLGVLCVLGGVLMLVDFLFAGSRVQVFPG